MDSTEPTTTQNLKSLFGKVDTKLIELSTKPSFAREAIMFCTNLGLYTMDIFRYFSHQPKSPHDPLSLGVPLQTEGIAGFFDQHIGDLGPTIALIYASRIPIEMGTKVYEAICDKKVNPRIKLYLAVLMGMTYPTMMELGVMPGSGNTKDPLDLFGIVVAGIVVTAGFETAEFLSTRPTNYWTERFTKLQEKIKPFANVAIEKFEKFFPS